MKTLSLIGYGKMAKALIYGLLDDFSIEVIGRDEQKLLELQTHIKQKYGKSINVIKLESNLDISQKSILLCIKPYALADIAKLHPKGEANYAISILAGTSLDSLKNALQAQHYARAMPNIAAEYSKSATTLCGDESIKQTSLEIFEKIGSTVWVNSEKELDIATALAGSGPAFLALCAEALTDGAVKEGLKREIATELTKNLFAGFSKLLEHNHPKDIKESVMSPGGTTAAGIFSLEENGTRGALMKAIESAFRKSQEFKKA